jgi:RNA polymerase sigma factor (TIGR02999 family)
VDDITLMLEAAQRNEPGSADRLIEAVYKELHSLASAKLAGERNNLTLQATELVHEAWLRLGGDRQNNWQNRSHFFSSAAEAMRRILVDRARRRCRIRRGEGDRPVSLDDEMNLPAPQQAEHIVAVNEALQRLAATDHQCAEVVKLRYFIGLTIPEIAMVLGVSESTTKRIWEFSRAWLFRELARS